MQPETYKAVCEFLGRDMVSEFPPRQFEGAHVEFSPEELMVRQDLAKNKLRWSDDYYRDRRYFLNNMHPILALFHAHRLHVVSRKERAAVYIVQIFFVLLVSLTFPFASRCGSGNCETVGSAGVGEGHPCVFPFTYQGETYNSCTTENYFKRSDLTITGAHQGRLWCSVKTGNNGQHVDGEWGHCWCQQGNAHDQCWNNLLSSAEVYKAKGHRYVHGVLCCAAHYTGVDWFAQTFQMGGLDLGGTLYASVLNTLFMLGSFQLMICGCVQKQSAAVRQCGEQTGHVIYGILTILILLPQPYLIMYAWKHGLLASTMCVFLSSKISSYMAITALQLIAFHFLWGLLEPDSLEETDDGIKKSDKPSRECMPALTDYHVKSSEYEAFCRHRREHGTSKTVL